MKYDSYLSSPSLLLYGFHLSAIRGDKGCVQDISLLIAMFGILYENRVQDLDSLGEVQYIHQSWMSERRSQIVSIPLLIGACFPDAIWPPKVCFLPH